MGGGGSKPTGFTGTKAMSAEDLNSAMRGDIQATYLKGPNQQSYTGMSDDTKNAMRSVIATGHDNAGIVRNAAGYNQGILDSGGLSAPQTQSMDYFRGVMQGGDQDPAYQRLRQNAIDDTKTAYNQTFSNSGRLGAGSHVRDMSEGIADAAAGMDYRNLQRQDAAAQGLFGMGQTGTANAIGAIDRAPGLYEGVMAPFTTDLQLRGLMDSDRAAEAAFDPQYEHLLKYQGLLGNNASGPQPAKKPGFFDYAGLGLGLLGSFL